MGGLASTAAAAVTTAARLVPDAYMAAPADVAAAPTTGTAAAASPMSYIVWTCFCTNLYGFVWT